MEGSESGRVAGGDSGHTLSACAFHQPLAVNASAVGGNDLPEPAGACAERAEIVAIVVDKKATAAVVEWQ